MSGSLTLALSVGSDTGASHTDNVTNDTTPTIVGTADPLSTVTLFDMNGAVLGRAIADKLGRYVITSLPLAAGPHALTVQSGGIGHMTATSAPLNIAVQTAASATVTVTPGLPPGADSVSFSIRFAQPVSAVAATSFAVGVTGSAFGTVEAVSGSGTNYTVTIDGVGGTGTIFLMSGSTPLTDLAGNVVTLNQAQSHAVTDTTDPSDIVVSSSAAGVAGSGQNGSPSVSGRIVAFLSQDGALLPDGPAGTVQNVYVKDIETGAIALVSAGVGGNANGDAEGVQLSADGSTIAFSSLATNLVAGKTPPSPFNLYVAHITTNPDTGAVQLTAGSISLVAPLDYDPLLGVFTLSANGHFVAFEAPDSLSGSSDGNDAVYLKNLATGTLTNLTQLLGIEIDELSSISGDGTEVAYTGFANDGVLPQGSNPSEHAYVYNLLTGKTTVLDGYGVFDGQPGVVDPSPDQENLSYYDTSDPVLSADGTVVSYLVHSDVGKGSLYSVFRSVLPGNTPLPVSTGAFSAGGADNDAYNGSDADGAFFAYQASDTGDLTGEVYSSLSGTSTSIGPAAAPELTADGNAVVSNGLLTTGGPVTAFETSLGVSASILPIDGNDAVDATELKQAAPAGLSVTGTTNAPAGATVSVQLLNGAGAALASVSGVVTGGGQWKATLPAAALGQSDGNYVLSVQVTAAGGRSALVSRSFVLDTMAPAAPTAPRLDPGFDTGAARDGSVTDSGLPTLTGNAEPGSKVTLYDADGVAPLKPIGSAIADADGVYSISLGPPSDSSANQSVPVPPPTTATFVAPAGSIDGVSPTLFYALLAMDAYNRGSHSGLDVGGVGPAFQTTLGLTTLGLNSDSDFSLAQNPISVGFSAQSYELEGKTIISYRGTDTASTLDMLTDVVNGWIAGGGVATAQTALALNFYQDLTQSTLTGPTNPNVVLTGHSLGGGLAGYIGSITGDQSFAFDNEPYAWAATNFVVQYNSAHPTQAQLALPTGGSVTADHTAGEILEPIRSDNAAFAITLLNAIAADAAAGPVAAAGDVSAAGAIAGQQTNLPPLIAYMGDMPPNISATALATELHSVALLALLQYASDNSLTAWLNGGVGQDLLAAYFNNDLAASLGVGLFAGVNPPAAKMLSMIAYSAIPEGAMPFGDTGIQALFSGADALGSLYPQSAGPLATPTIEQDLANIDVSYAGWLAENQDENANHVSGEISYDDVEHSLTVDVSDQFWQVANPTTGLTLTRSPSAITGWVDLLNQVDLGVLAPAIATNIRRLIIATGTSDVLDAPNATGQTLIVASIGGSVINGSNGDDLIVSPNQGSNEIDGGAGTDEVLYSGAGVNTGSAGDYVVSQDADGSFTVVKPGGGVDTLTGVELIGFADGQTYGLTGQGADAFLADGLHHLTVVATDAAGNASAASPMLSLTVESQVPDAPIAGLAPSSDTGTSDTDGITDDPTPTITGTTEADATVTLYDQSAGTVLGTTKADGGGAFSIVSAPLLDGLHALTVTATDSAGNVSAASSTLLVTIDTVAPAAPTLKSVDANGGAFGYEVAGAAEAESTLSLSADGGTTVLDTTAAADDGTYDFIVPALPIGANSLTVTATDAAGNVSPASSPYALTISDTAVVPPGAPPGTVTLNGIVIDGPIAGATVFADANGNGKRDAGEGLAVTGTDGGFTLADTGGQLIASGGTDTETGLPLPGALTAPAYSTVIDPLTTLLNAYAAATGQTPQAAQPALLAILGLNPAADLTRINPETAAAGGDPSFLIADAKVIDSVVVLADLVAAQTGVSPAVAFAASVTALAQQAATGTLDLQTYATDVVNAAAAAAAIADPGFVLPNGLAEDAAIIIDNGNYELANVSSQTDPSAALTMVDAIEFVEQGQAAPQLAAASGNQAAADLVAQTYSSGLSGAVTNAEIRILAAPVLAPSDDTGVSAHDDLTSNTTPTFTGKAPPGATVILAQVIFNTPGIYTIVGSGIADASGAYTVATTLPRGNDSPDNILAFQAAPGQATAVGTQFSAPTNLTDAEITAVTVGDLPADGGNVPPTIEKVVYTASSGNDATETSLYVTGSGAGTIDEGAFYTVTANGNPVTEAAGQGEGSGGNFGILTTPLAAGTYSLVVTETALDGETAQSAPVIVTVTALGSLGIQAEAGGQVSGGSIVGYNSGYPYLVMAPDTEHPYATTDASGAASVPAQNTIPLQGGTLYPTDANGLALEGGQDALTGLILPVNLSAPPGSSVITPATSLLLQADVDAATVGLDATGPYTVTATDYAYENSRIDTALGLPTTLDLTTADPLAMAEAGNPALFLKDIELLDTTFLLLPFTENGDAGFDTIDPLHVINESLGIIKFINFLSGAAPPVTTRPIDFTSAAEVLSWMTTFDNSGIGGSYDTQYDASVLPTAAAIIAAGNAAIEAFAAASTSLPDTIAYALAVERVTLSGEEQALAALAVGLGSSVAKQQAGFATLQAEYTGSGLQAAVAAALAQTVQVTSFSAASASTGAAQDTFTITFSAPVGGVTAGDFTVAGSAGLAGALVSAVTPVAGSGGAAYTVTVATGVGNGTLTLDFTPNGLSNPDGSPLSTGSFAAPHSYSAPTGRGYDVANPATGDFNGDGHTDVVIANKDDADGITLFLGQGDGSYVAEPVIYTGSETGAIQVVTGDFNGDGKLDAVTLNNPYSPGYGGYENGDATVSAMLGDGDGGFAGPVETDVGPSAGYMVAGDFNGDGKLDLAVLNGNLQLFYGNGDGTFRAGPTTTVGVPLYSGDQLVAADLNGDGKLDLVIPTFAATTGAPGVAILLGNGQGGFTLAAQPTLGFTTITDNGVAATLVTVADLNGDGIPDIVAVPKASAASNNSAEVLLGNGNGTFRDAISVKLPAISLPPALSYSGDGNNVAISIGDVTGDGKPDIVVENDLAGVVIAPGNGDGTFGPAYSDAAAAAGYDGNNTFGQMTLADVNGDGRLDLIATQSGGEEAGSSTTSGIAVSLGTAQTVLPASASVTVNRAAEAQPALAQVSGAGTLTGSGTSYTLNLGTLAQGSTAAAVLALANTAAAPADSFDGTFSTPTGTGFTVAGATLPQPVAAGGSYGGLTFTANTGAPGTYSETITFAPRDATAIPAAAATPDPNGGDAASPAAVSVANPVALELAPLTLTITDNVVAGGLAAAALAPVPSIALPNVRVGGTDSEAITITNTAPAPAADLDVTATATGDATVTGSVSGLAPQASDTMSVIAGVGTATAGQQTGTITLAPVSEPSALLTAQTVAISGSVYRPATAVITPISAIVHVGDPGLLSLGITNADPADGFSEDLRATVTNVSGPFSASAGESTGLVSAGTLSRALAVSFSTMATSLLTGTATIGLVSDGTGLDGLGTLALPSQTAPLSVTVDNYASAALQLLSGTGVLSASGTNYTLDLGTIFQGASLTAVLGVTNAASGPADLLSGHFALSDANAIGLTGFGDFAGLASGQTDGGLDVSLDASAAGTFTRTVTLTPTGSNASGYSGALTPETLTITSTVAAVAAASGSSPGGTPVATGTQPGTSTPSVTTPVYRFFDTIHGTHLFTQSLSEAQNIVSTRPDLMEETNNFGAVTPQNDPNAQAVYRFFEASNGTHFLTASYQEYLGLTTAGTSTYRPDLTYEPNSTFYEHATPQSGDVAVYRFFDTVQGTQYLTASQTEYAGLTTAGTSTYRPDLIPEGTAFYAPPGSFST